METCNAIQTRRSVRQFQDRPVQESDLKLLITMAAWAPSWKNSQTTRYYAVADPAVKEALAADCVLGFAGNQNIIRSAPLVLVLSTISGHSGYNRDGSFTTSKGTHWESFDAGIAAQTLCLAAHDMGLATVIMGIFDEQKVADLISLPAQQTVSALIALGYAAVDPNPAPRKAVDDLLTLI